MHMGACNAKCGPVALVGEGLGPSDTTHILQRPLRSINEIEVRISVRRGCGAFETAWS